MASNYKISTAIILNTTPKGRTNYYDFELESILLENLEIAYSI